MVTTRFTYAILTDTHGLKAQIFNFIKSRAIDDPSVFSLKNNIFKAFKSLQLTKHFCNESYLLILE